MKYKRFNNKIVLRVDRGEEILSSIKTLALSENIQLASIVGLGAVDSFQVGVYKVDEKKFYPNEFNGCYEIVSLVGTIDTMNGEFYSHLHMSAGDESGKVYGGHLSRAVVSATAEIIVDVIDGNVDRFIDDETGLNLLEL